MVSKDKLDAAINKISRLLLEGYFATEIAEASKDDETILANAFTIKKRIFKQFREAANPHPEILRGWALQATQLQYQRLTASGDYAGALRAIKQILDIVNSDI